MQGSPSKNIQNIAVQLNLAERKKNITFKSDSKPKMEIKSFPLTTMKHQRNLSPWNRKKDYRAGKIASIHDDPNLQVVNLIQRQIDVNSKNQSIVLTEEKMSDFLQKIHFTNKKKSTSEGINLPYKPNKLQQNDIIGKKQSLKKSPSHDLTDLTQEEIRKIIIYPKNTQKNDMNGKMKSNLKEKNKQNSVNKMASIQNFYDPYQNKTKISRKLLKYRLKLNEQLSQQANTTRVNDSVLSHLDFQITWRKNSIPQKVHRRNFSMPDDEMHQSRKVRVKNQNEMRGTFFQTRTSNFQRNFKTQPTQRDKQPKQDPQKNHIQHEQQKQRTLSSFEPSYATPSGQAIKRIKHQYKKSRRVKTTQNNFRTQHSKSEIQPSTRQNNFYLYQTFLNYKSNKDSSGMNITKTLGFNFHNQQTFKQNIQKVWLKSKH